MSTDTSAGNLPMASLVPFTEDDIDAVLSWLPNQRAVAVWGGPSMPFPLRPVHLLQQLEEARETPPPRHCWTLEHASLGRIGHVQLACDWHNRVGRIGKVIIAPAARGRGLAGTLIQHVLAHAFTVDGMERVELNVYPFNTPAIRTYEAQGFTHEGNRRSSARVGDERWDTLIMGILKQEWAARQT